METRILATLRRARGAPVPIGTLVASVGAKGDVETRLGTVRSLVTRLRRRGHPIAAVRGAYRLIPKGGPRT